MTYGLDKKYFYAVIYSFLWKHTETYNAFSFQEIFFCLFKAAVFTALYCTLSLATFAARVSIEHWRAHKEQQQRSRDPPQSSFSLAPGLTFSHVLVLWCVYSSYKGTKPIQYMVTYSRVSTHRRGESIYWVLSTRH